MKRVFTRDRGSGSLSGQMLFLMSLTTFLSCVGAERVVIVIGLACQSNRIALCCPRLLREACLWDCHPCYFSFHCHSHLVST